ncbi:ComE operon protein 1 [Mycobacteroides abscessus subsp. abscessus]|uniref:ComEA family DNA-binding protein n=1 Tax=Mycobacteroides abscessus TaxID=36809 RepID=UPI00092BE77A|nr:ComEA family DNA-binding protein [Mycobacteroides abscessus]SHT76964.1 ComE operon protein 1 [Mycobacteroides abscessus subsp. abscessus]SHW75532.1 ComE operon protein 1 [Mycobacteroides abscessus subsp. abscessus]SIG40714.1 ComE operon protein 1 [Mycobacteroides abscessus subsp. abscessus]SKD18539.1 ComE operon protein 1 [Mycobacteroides abscessus subsp. abscessus]SKM07103.1 ComE operon protein 1 [Mycobacteroides abscessus subsp. abscessus]
MEPELLHRRLAPAGREFDDDDEDDDDDDDEDEDLARAAAGSEPESALRWLPDSLTAGGTRGWLESVRTDPGRAGVVALGAIGVLAVLVTVFTVMRQPPAPVSANLPPVQPVSSSSVSAPSSLVISVVGLVKRPGLVTLATGARVADAVTAAGGAVDGADVITLNMARPVADGDQIVVGLAPVPGQPVGMASSIVAAGQTPAGSTGSKGPGAPGRVNLNTATESELDALPGVGPVMAASIVRWRSEHGKFTGIDQLAEVDGIGPSRLDKLRDFVVL